MGNMIIYPIEFLHSLGQRLTLKARHNGRALTEKIGCYATFLLRLNAKPAKPMSVRVEGSGTDEVSVTVICHS